MRVARRAGVVYICFGQYPRLRGRTPVYRRGRWRLAGESREEPFLFTDRVRGVIPMAAAAGGNGYVLYLTLFSLRAWDLD
jgi:hypothetical protein